MGKKLITFGLIVFLTSLSPALAQEARASVSGRVLDNTGGVIPGVSVVATNLATNVSVSTMTNESGNYRIDYLNPGRYDISVSLPGFKTAKRAVDLRTGDQPQLDFTLQVGEVTEEIIVEAETPLLQTRTAGISQLIDNERLETIPLAQGNPTHLLILAAGAVSPPGGAWKFDEPGWSIATDFAFHGVRGSAIAFTLNGVNNTGTIFGGSQQAQAQPPAEAVQEMKISHEYDASRGHHTGTTLDVTLKSGTNKFHGSVYGFFRDSDLDSAAFFDNRTGAPKPPSNYRRIGGSITGPVFKDRTFFAFTFEDTYQKTTEFYGTRTVPTAEMLNGDFSKLLALGPVYQIYDPLTTRPTGDGFFTRDPFPGNIIPAGRIHPISKKLMEFWPSPNVTGSADGTSNFQPLTASPTAWKQIFTRIDHNFTPNHRIFGHYTVLTDWAGEWRDYYGNLATGFFEAIERQSFGIDDVYSWSPNLLLNLRYGFNRGTDPRLHKSHRGSPHGFFDITTLGLSDRLISQLDLDQTALPHILIQGFSGIHDETRNNFDAFHNHSAEISADIIRGEHNFKVGFDFRTSYLNRADKLWTMPRYQFDCDFTNGPLNVSPCAQGQGFAAFLLGQPAGGFIRRVDNFAAHNAYYGTFFQDNWRINPKLTVDFGLRWEYYGPLTERFDRSVRGFAFDASSPIEAAAQAQYAMNPIPEIPVDQFRVRGGVTFAGVGGQPRELYDTPNNLFAPRIGLAYRLADETVLRMGYGLFHVPVGILGSSGFQPILAGFDRPTDLVPTLDNGVTFIADIVDPFPSILDPFGSSLGLATNLGQSVRFFNTENLGIPYSQRWSVTIQHMLPNRTLLEVGYIGTRGTKLFLSRDLNALPRNYLSTLSVRDQATISFLGQSVTNPFAGLLPRTALNANTVARNQLLKPYPQFTAVTLPHLDQGYSWYHALGTTLEKRFSEGHTYTLSYTWSKTMEAIEYLNPSDPLPYESVSSFDRTHVLKLTGIWELPFGKNKPFGAGAPSGLLHAITGWKVSAVWHAESGFPLTFGSDLFMDSSFNPKTLPLSESQRSVDRWFNTDAGFVRSPQQQPAFHLRTFPLRFSNLRSDGTNFWDISVIKNTYVREEAYVQFQAQFLNAFNQPNFGAAVTNPASGSFGRVLSDVTWPRRIMFGIKFVF